MSTAAVGFDEFYEAQQPRLVAFALAMGIDAQRARDVAQETLLRAYQRWDVVRTLDRPQAWVRKVAMNLMISAHRRRTREERANALLASSAVVALPDPVHDRFWQHVRDLPERQRAVVALHYLEDMPLASIADVLDCAEGTVKSLLFKARTRLAQTLAAEVA